MNSDKILQISEKITVSYGLLKKKFVIFIL